MIYIYIVSVLYVDRNNEDIKSDDYEGLLCTPVLKRWLVNIKEDSI
jgi:hypothetical protein